MPKPSDWSSVADGDGEMSPGPTTHMSPCCRNCQRIFRSHLGQTSALVSQNAPLERCSVDLLLDDVRLSHTTLQIFSANYYHGSPTLGSSIREISNFYPGRRIHYSSRLFANFSRQQKHLQCLQLIL